MKFFLGIDRAGQEIIVKNFPDCMFKFSLKLYVSFMWMKFSDPPLSYYSCLEPGKFNCPCCIHHDIPVLMSH